MKPGNNHGKVHGKIHRTVRRNPISPARHPVARWAAAVMLLLILWAPAAREVRAEPNFFEQRRIEAKALEAFRRVIVLWQEEVYFELYDEGMSASKARISQEEFAQRMVELSWVPHGELNPKYLKADFRFRTVVYVSARIPYRHKFNPESRFSKQQTMVLIFEKGRWRVDLIELIRSPYSGV